MEIGKGKVPLKLYGYEMPKLEVVENLHSSMKFNPSLKKFQEHSDAVLCPW